MQECIQFGIRMDHGTGNMVHALNADNQAAVNALVSARPTLVDIVPAVEVCPELAEGVLLHAGPPLADGEDPVGPMQGALEGALAYESTLRGGADNLQDARPSGAQRLKPCHDAGFVGPLAGVVSANMPVWVVRDESTGVTAHATLNEGLGQVLRYGAQGPEVLRRLTWMKDVLAPVLKRALLGREGIDLRTMMAEALRRGDELHNRNKSATSAFIRELAPDIARHGGAHAVEVLEFLRNNDHFFLNISIAAAKCAADSAAQTGRGTVVTAMSSNGRRFGIRLSGTGDKWFVARAPKAEAVYFEGYDDEDACPVLGDSFITEVVGLGGFALAAAPAIASFVGGKPSQLALRNLEMYRITLIEHPHFTIPSLDYRGVPVGIDARQVVDKRIQPSLNSGIAHRRAGVGQVGAGIVLAPYECFESAMDAVGAAPGGSMEAAGQRMNPARIV